MPDPTETASGATTAGETGQGTGLTAAQVEAIEAAVSTALSQMQAQLNSLSENVNKINQATTSDVDTATVSRSSIDPASPQRRQETYAEMAVADCIEFRKACDALILRKISQDTDHHGAIPPIAPRSATGPGTSAS